MSDWLSLLSLSQHTLPFRGVPWHPCLAVPPWHRSSRVWAAQGGDGERRRKKRRQQRFPQPPRSVPVEGFTAVNLSCIFPYPGPAHQDTDAPWARLQLVMSLSHPQLCAQPMPPLECRRAAGQKQAAAPGSPQWEQAENTPGEQGTRGRSRRGPGMPNHVFQPHASALGVRPTRRW